MKPYTFRHDPNSSHWDADEFGPAAIWANDQGATVFPVGNSAPIIAGTALPGAGSGAAAGGGVVASPFVINITYDASVSNAPAGFKTTIDAAVL